MPLRRFLSCFWRFCSACCPAAESAPSPPVWSLSSMGVECSARPLTAVLEVIREEENETITVQGESFTALFFRRRAPNRGAGLPWCAAKHRLFRRARWQHAAGVSPCAAGRWKAFPNTQIALCGDALSLYDGEALTGDSITALLTRQYTDSRRNGLKELLNLLEGPAGMV